MLVSRPSLFGLSSGGLAEPASPLRIDPLNYSHTSSSHWSGGYTWYDTGWVGRKMQGTDQPEFSASGTAAAEALNFPIQWLPFIDAGRVQLFSQAQWRRRGSSYMRFRNRVYDDVDWTGTQLQNDYSSWKSGSADSTVTSTDIFTLAAGARSFRPGIRGDQCAPGNRYVVVFYQFYELRLLPA